MGAGMSGVKKRIDYFDIAKGIGIIMVVWAHAKGPFSRFIYQMHMPFFFLLSGLLYSFNTPVKEYIVKKLKVYIFHLYFGTCLFLQ